MTYLENSGGMVTLSLSIVNNFYGISVLRKRRGQIHRLTRGFSPHLAPSSVGLDDRMLSNSTLPTRTTNSACAPAKKNAAHHAPLSR
jgi:hypothetical protein